MRGFAGTAFPLRLCWLLALFGLALLVLTLRLLDLQWLKRDFLEQQGDARSLRHISIAAPRGMIVDRNGLPLAVSTPLITLEAGKNLWTPPRVLKKDERKRLRRLAQQLGYAEDEFVQRIEAEGSRARWAEIADVLGESPQALRRRLEQVSNRNAYDLARQLSPEQAAKVMALKIPGIYARRHYRRYYPSGEQVVQLIGRSNIDDRGQEGLELAFDGWLAGSKGKRLVLQDKNGRLLEDFGVVQQPKAGKDLQLSIDLRLQNLANRELHESLQQSGAKAGALVLLDVQSGEVLALVNQPSFNPNNRASYNPAPARNRALLDNIEPGSTVKPLTILAALQSGRWQPGDTVDLGASRSLYVDRFSPITDVTRSGPQTPNLTQILIDSSNIGASKIALDIGPSAIHELMHRLGVGQGTGLAFPGEGTGALPAHKYWTKRQIANLSYGYGVEMTLVQLAHIYLTLANDGYMRPLSLLRLETVPQGEQVIDKTIAKTVREMLQQVVEAPRGVFRARVPDYQVAGKSGTVEKRQGGRGYGDSHRALFVGFAPASSPRFVLAVMLDEPQKKSGQRVHFGGAAAAPVFSRVMEGALRLMQVPSDAPKATLTAGASR